MILTVGLLLLSNAWLVLLIPSNWENSIASKMSFGTTMGILVWWWTTLLGGLIVVIALAARPVHFTFPMGTYVQYDNSPPEPVQGGFHREQHALNRTGKDRLGSRGLRLACSVLQPAPALRDGRCIG
jgi:hypothetical protein